MDLRIAHELLLACRDLVNHLSTGHTLWRCVNPSLRFATRNTSQLAVRRWSHHGVRRCLGMVRMDRPWSLAHATRLRHSHIVRPRWDRSSDIVNSRIRLLLIQLTRLPVEGLRLLRRVNLDVSLHRKATRGMVMNVLRWCSSVYELLLLLLLLLRWCRLLLELRVEDVSRVLILHMVLG